MAMEWKNEGKKTHTEKKWKWGKRWSWLRAAIWWSAILFSFGKWVCLSSCPKSPAPWPTKKKPPDCVPFSNVNSVVTTCRPGKKKGVCESGKMPPLADSGFSRSSSLWAPRKGNARNVEEKRGKWSTTLFKLIFLIWVFWFFAGEVQPSQVVKWSTAIYVDILDDL